MYLLPEQKDKLGNKILGVTETPIFLIVRWEGNKLVYSTDLAIEPKYWEMDKKKDNFQRAKRVKQFPTYPEFNTRLDFINTISKDTFRKYVNDHNQQPTLKVYRDLLNLAFNKKAPIKHDLISFAEAFKLLVEARITKKVSVHTTQAYGQTIFHLKAFKEATNTRTEFDNIDEDFYNDFVKYLTNIKKFSPNTIGKHIKHLKIFIREAKSLDSNIVDRTAKFTGMKEDTDSIYLSHDELTELYNLDLTENKRLEKVRDLFILGSYTGLRFSDFSRLTNENILEDRIKIVSQKTKKPVSIPFHHTVKSIIEKYGCVFPQISNVKMNEYLKELGKLTKLLKVDIHAKKTRGGLEVSKKVKKHDLVTTHTARRSFATNAYLDGVPSLTIMAITGHSTEKSFLRYIKVTPDEHAKILDLHWKNDVKLKAV
jgi:integrase